MRFLSFLIVLLSINLSYAKVILPSVFTDHMVLQQNDTVNFWGWATPDEKITISPSWTTETYTTEADRQANWRIEIKTPSYGGPYTIHIKAANEIVLKDVMIGEVWLCSGQSNMEMSVEWGIDNGEEVAAKANYNGIRFFNVPKIPATTPQNNIVAKWEVCTPETMRQTTAIGYFFAEKMHQDLKNIPIGIIRSAWGGTPAEIWMPKSVVEKDPVINASAKKQKKQKYGPSEAGRAFNGMLHPLANYKIAGALWYQGESNVGSTVYDKTLSALITSWRSIWNKALPFYLVQIAPFNYADAYTGVVIRDAQRLVAKNTMHTEMVVISDISATDDIHPKDKKSVGERLANIALKKHYKTMGDLVESPEVSTVSFEKNKVVVRFKYADGLYVKDKQSMFEVAGDDKIFYAAKGRLNKDVIVVKSSKVSGPKYVRFAWGNNAQSNIFNKANLPLSSFSIGN